MLLIVLAILVISPALVGWGTAFSTQFLGRSFDTNIGELGMLGLFVVSLLGLALHFVLALSSTVVLAILIGGYYLLWRNARVLVPFVTALPRWQLAMPLFFAFFFAFFAFIREYHADTELYHLPSIVWAHQSRVPIGLANLVDQFGFNTTWFITAALAWLPGFELTSVFGVDALITAMFFLALFQHGSEVVHGERASASRVFALVLFVFLFTGGVSFIRIIGSPNPDIPASLVTIYCFVLSLRILENKTNDRALVQDWFLLVSFCVFALVIKVSQAPLVFLPLLLGTSAYMAKNGPNIEKCTLVGAGVIVVALLLWLARGLMASGCMAYPVASSCIESIPWAVTRESAIGQHDGIRAFGLYGEMGRNLGLTDWSWLPSWWVRFRAHHFVRGMAYTLFVVAVISVYVRGRTWHANRTDEGDTSTLRRQRWFELPHNYWWLPLCATAFLGYWFLGAPDIRFGYGYLTVLMGLIILWLMSGVEVRYRKFFTYPLAVLVMISIVLHLGKLVLTIEKDDWFGRWPAIEAKPLPKAPCPDLFGVWPLFKCSI
jgi:hypothetical protein